jgi:tRNA1(Val) A37 N6-methylase TrmN6
MPTLSEIKTEHLEHIKAYLKEYLSNGNQITFIEPKEDHYAAYMLIGIYTGGDYGLFESSDGTILNALIVNENYKHLQYELAVKLLISIK